MKKELDKQSNITQFEFGNTEKSAKEITPERQEFIENHVQQNFYTECIGVINKMTDLTFPKPYKKYKVTISIKMREIKK